MGRRRAKGRDVNGILLLDKPSGITSNAALQQVKRLFRARKAGHTGSLDPLADGMLPICFGDATKLSAFLLDADKHYWFRVRLGVSTTTGDAEPLDPWQLPGHQAHLHIVGRLQLLFEFPHQSPFSLTQVTAMLERIPRNNEQTYEHQPGNDDCLSAVYRGRLRVGNSLESDSQQKGVSCRVFSRQPRAGNVGTSVYVCRNQRIGGKLRRISVFDL